MPNSLSPFLSFQFFGNVPLSEVEFQPTNFLLGMIGTIFLVILINFFSK